MDGGSQSDFVFHTDTSQNLIRMQSNCRTQASILRAMHDGDRSLCDVTLFGVPPENMQTNSLQPIRAHKLVLIYASKHLYDLLNTEPRLSEYRIENIDHESLRRIVDFMYTDQLTAPAENAVEIMCRVLIGAKYLTMKNLADACETFLAGGVRLKPENCVVMWCFARKHACLELMHATSTFIAKNLSDILRDADFLRMPYDDYAKLLLSEAAIAADVDQRCLAAITWLSYDSVGRVPYIHDIFNMVPLTPGSVSEDTVRELTKCDMFWEHAVNTIRILTTAALSVRKDLMPTGSKPPPVIHAPLPAANSASTEQPAVSSASASQDSWKQRHWYVVGGDNTPRLFMHYDVDRKTWSYLPPLPWERAHISACAHRFACADRLVTMGGEKNGAETVDIDEYDLVTNTWNATCCAKLSRPARLTTVCSQQNVYALNVLYVEKYNWQTGRVVKLNRMNPISATICAAAAVKGSIFIAGGWQSEGWIEKYDMNTNMLTKVGRMGKKLSGLAATISGDDFYLIGGSYCLGVLPPTNSVEIFNIRTGRVSAAPNLLQSRIRGGATTLYDGNVICVVGGEGGELDGHLATVECLDKREGKWTTGSIVPNMPQTAANFGFATL